MIKHTNFIQFTSSTVCFDVCVLHSHLMHKINSLQLKGDERSDEEEDEEGSEEEYTHTNGYANGSGNGLSNGH